MLETIFAMMLLATLVLTPLGLSLWWDRVRDRALAVRAEVHWAARKALHGDSFLSIDVRPAAPWRPGQVILSTPSGWDWLVPAVWNRVVERVPGNYEVVVKPGCRPVAGATPRPHALRHAA